MKGEGISRRPDNTSERVVTIGVSGAFLVIDALGVTMFEGKNSVLDCSSIVGPVDWARPVDSVGT